MAITDIQNAFLKGYGAMKAMFGSNIGRFTVKPPAPPPPDYDIGSYYYFMLYDNGLWIAECSTARFYVEGGWITIPAGAKMRSYAYLNNEWVADGDLYVVEEVEYLVELSELDTIKSSAMLITNFDPPFLDNKAGTAYQLKQAFLSGVGSGVPRTISKRFSFGQQLECIRSTGTQYIDTGYIPNELTRVICRAEVPNTSGTNWVFGARQSSSARLFTFAFSTNGYFVAAFNKTTASFSKEWNTEKKMTIDMGYMLDWCQCNLYTEHGNVSSKSFGYDSFTCPVSLTIFAGNTNNTITRGKVTIYSFDIWEGESMVMSLVPYMQGNGTVGMRDTISGRFFPNAGTGEFEYSEIM